MKKKVIALLCLIVTVCCIAFAISRCIPKPQGSVDDFNIDKAKSIEIGFTSEQVTQLLGEPYVGYGEKFSSTSWEYYDSSYLVTSKSLDDKKEKRQAALDSGDALQVTSLTQEINELQEKLNIMTYKYVKINFKQIGTYMNPIYSVSEIAYNSVRSPLITIDKSVNQIDLNIKRISTLTDINCVEIAAKINYNDGSFRSYYLDKSTYQNLDNSSPQEVKIEWTDDWSSKVYKSTISVTDVLKKGDTITNSFGNGKFTATAISDSKQDELPDFAITFIDTGNKLNYDKDKDVAWEKVSSHVKKLTIPETTSVRADFSILNNNIENIEVEEENKEIRVEGNCIIGISDNKIIKGFNNSVIPDGVVGICQNAFYNCSSLINLKIPDSVMSIGDKAFYGCIELESITVGENNAKYNSEGNCLLNKDGDKLILGCKNSTIPDGVVNIGDNAFDYCIGLTSINLPKSLTRIGADAFNDCYRLIEVCNNSRLKITEGSSDNGYIGYRVKNIYGNGKGSSKLITDSNGFVYFGATLVNYVGEATEITVPNGVKTIYNFAFYNCKKLTSITLPDITYVGMYAFKNCINLTSITAPNIEYIDLGAFHNCRKLTDLTLPEETKHIGILAFAGCRSLTSIAIPKRAMPIPNFAFAGCSSLTTITFNGTIAQWKAFGGNGIDWDRDTGDYVVQCTDGKLGKDGKEIK